MTESKQTSNEGHGAATTKWLDQIPDLLKEGSAIGALLTSIESVKDLNRLQQRKASLEATASDPNLWNDSDNAQKVTSELSRVQGELNLLTQLRRRVEELPLLFELAKVRETKVLSRMH